MSRMLHQAAWDTMHADCTKDFLVLVVKPTAKSATKDTCIVLHPQLSASEPEVERQCRKSVRETSTSLAIRANCAFATLLTRKLS